MTFPWDRPKPPRQCDIDIRDTYAGVGLVLSTWEEVEVCLAHLYAEFKGARKELDVFREYGAPTIFSARLALLAKTACSYFHRNPNQAHEGRFGLLQEKCTKLSARRNDIAHGIVNPTTFSHRNNPDTGMVDIIGHQFCLVPPHYDPKRHSAHDQEEPEFAYAKADMEILSQAMWDLRLEIIHYSDSVFEPLQGQS